MKKVLLSAFVCVAFSATAFAEGSKGEPKKQLLEKESSESVSPCEFKIFIRNKDNKVVKTIDYKGTAPGSVECCDWAKKEVKNQTNMLNPMSGYTASHDLTGC